MHCSRHVYGVRLRDSAHDGNVEPKSKRQIEKQRIDVGVDGKMTIWIARAVTLTWIGYHNAESSSFA